MASKRINISNIQAQLERLEAKKAEAIKTIDARLESAKTRLENAQAHYDKVIADKAFLESKPASAVNMTQAQADKGEVTTVKTDGEL
jgi:guanylate kinase